MHFPSTPILAWPGTHPMQLELPLERVVCPSGHGKHEVEFILGV